MPQHPTDSISPLAPFEGSAPLPGFDLTRRWFDARDFTPALSAEVLQVIRIAFNERADWFALPVALQDHLDWKYRDCPTGATLSVTLDQDDRVVGFLGSVRRTWFLHGRPYVNRIGSDHCLLPEWQGRGVARAIEEFYHRESHPSEDFSFSYVTHPADRYLEIAMGHRTIANETHDYVRPLHIVRRLLASIRRSRPAPDPSATDSPSATSQVIRQREQHLADRLRRRARRSLAFASSLLRRRPPPPPGDWTISTLSRFEPVHLPFITEALSQFDVVAERSLAYLNWRFCDERAGPFTVRLAHRDGHYLGYAVTRIRDADAGLADILVLPDHPQVAESLIRDAVDLAETAGAQSITTRLPEHHPYRSALARIGFFDIGPAAGELLDPRETPEAELALLDHPDTRIHHVLADSDYV